MDGGGDIERRVFSHPSYGQCGPTIQKKEDTERWRKGKFKKVADLFDKAGHLIKTEMVERFA